VTWLVGKDVINRLLADDDLRRIYGDIKDAQAMAETVLLTAQKKMEFAEFSIERKAWGSVYSNIWQVVYGATRALLQAQGLRPRSFESGGEQVAVTAAVAQLGGEFPLVAKHIQRIYKIYTIGEYHSSILDFFIVDQYLVEQELINLETILNVCRDLIPNMTIFEPDCLDLSTEPKMRNPQRMGTGNASPALSPLFRSHAQGLVLTQLLMGEPEQSLLSLASKTGLGIEIIKDEMTQLKTAYLITSRQQSGKLIYRVSAPSNLREIMLELVIRSYGVVEILSQELSGVAGIETAYVFGSWAARYLRVPGRMPHDIDILVVGSPDRNHLHDATGRAGEKIGKDVMAHTYPRKAWENRLDGFLGSVKKTPLVPIRIEVNDE
jgi:hypothetical protein